MTDQKQFAQRAQAFAVALSRIMRAYRHSDGTRVGYHEVLAAFNHLTALMIEDRCPDPEKQANEAIRAFQNLCNTLGVTFVMTEMPPAPTSDKQH